MSKLTKRRIEYWTAGAIELILVLSGIFLLFFNWIISLVLFSLALGIPLIYYYLTSLRVKLKIWRLIPKAQSCVIFLCIIISAIVILSTVSIIF
ncbi:MAG: hypothetical protein ACXADU_00145 [Promethearchaeota archaeon]|jgi:hypothetical protein